jgi:hypothetical protein
MTLPVTALLPLALALLLISALGFDLLRRLGSGRRPRARGTRHPADRAGPAGTGHGGDPTRRGEGGASRRPAAGPAPSVPARATLTARAPRPPLTRVDLPLDLPVRPPAAALPSGGTGRDARPRAAAPASARTTTSPVKAPEVGRQAATAQASNRHGPTPSPPPPHWRPPPRANDSRFDSRWNSSLLDSRWLSLSVRPLDAARTERRRPAAPVLPFPRRRTGSWSLAAAGAGLQPGPDAGWAGLDEGPARSDGGPETLPLRPPAPVQRRQPRR